MSTLQPPPAEEEFGSIAPTEEAIQDLWSLVHSQPRLRKAGYVLWQLGQPDLDKKKRCGRCTKVIRKGHEKQKSRAQSVKLAPTLAQQIVAGTSEEAEGEDGQITLLQHSHARSASLHANSASAPISDMFQDMTLKNNERTTGPPMNCKFHPGSIRQRQWTCCGKAIASPACAAEQFHTTRIYNPGELESNWEYFRTPHPEDYSVPPPTDQHAVAVVLDCEMGIAQSGEPELIRVSAVDMFTRQVLVDSLVWPDVPMAHLNTRFSGVSRHDMEQARRQRRTLAGREGARRALWRFVGPRTVVVGHSANSDLTALRWIHPFVVDTLLLEMRLQPPPPREGSEEGKKQDHVDGEAETEKREQDGPSSSSSATVEAVDAKTAGRPKYPGLSLKALAADRLKREIQIKSRGHDSLEDALATRDLLLWHLRHKPEPPTPVF